MQASRVQVTSTPSNDRVNGPRTNRRDFFKQAGAVMLGAASANTIAETLAKAGETNPGKTADIAPVTSAKQPEPKTVDKVLEELVEERFIPDDIDAKSLLKERLELADKQRLRSPELFLTQLRWLRDNKILLGREADMKYFVFNSDIEDKDGQKSSGIVEATRVVWGLINTANRAQKWYSDVKKMDPEIAYQEGLQEVRKKYLDDYINKYLKDSYKGPSNLDRIIAGFYLAKN